ncbi:hypothetical protein J6TS2_33450 [Heyndrickxia sporothermodurans]|nr:hypothetical protein J6TS2_33450 [Heyndrickxia sporothermodurans]
MLTETSLRNLYKLEYNSFFEKLGVLNYSQRLKTTNRKDYSKLVTLLKEEIDSPTGQFKAKQLDKFLFERIFYLKNNLHYVYQLDSHFILENDINDLENIRAYLSSFSDLRLDNQIPCETTDTFEICTTRLVTNQSGVVEQINLLIKCENVSTKRGVITLYSGVTIDIKNKLLLIKFNQNYLESHSSKPMLLHNIKLTLTNNSTFRPLKLHFSSITENHGRDLIFTLFKELSEDAEKILNKKASSDTDHKITNFLKSMGIETKKDYINQVKAVIYQDIADTFHKTLFPKGWVFRFLFREGDYTRASSRTDDFSPIYKAKVYWNLKEIVFKEKKMQEAGLVWNLPRTNGPIFVKIENKNESVQIQYYDKPANRKNRKEKEDYVLQKVNGNLRRN